MEGRVAKDCTDDGTVSTPQSFGPRLIPARRKYRDGAHLIRAAKVSVQCCQYPAKSGWVDGVARPLKLDAFEPMANFVHLEKHHHWHPADWLAGQDDVDISVTKIERSRQLVGISAELPEQFIGRFALLGLPGHLSDSDFREHGPG